MDAREGQIPSKPVDGSIYTFFHEHGDEWGFPVHLLTSLQRVEGTSKVG